MAIDDIVENVGQTSPLIHGDDEHSTENIVNALQPGQKYKFIIVPKMPEYQDLTVDPANFQDRAKYRGFLIEKSKEFFQANTSKARELMDKLGIEYRCMHIVKMFAADLTKDQYEIIKRSEEIESIIADRPLNLFKP